MRPSPALTASAVSRAAHSRSASRHSRRARRSGAHRHRHRRAGRPPMRNGRRPRPSSSAMPPISTVAPNAGAQSRLIATMSVSSSGSSDAGSSLKSRAASNSGGSTACRQDRTVPQPLMQFDGASASSSATATSIGMLGTIGSVSRMRLRAPAALDALPVDDAVDEIDRLAVRREGHQDAAIADASRRAGSRTRPRSRPARGWR